MCAVACTSVGIRLSVQCSNQNGISANGSRPSCHFSKIPAQVSSWLVRHFALILNLKMSLLPLFPEAISTSLLNDSCGGVAEDELFLKLTDNHGTTRSTQMSVLQIIFPFWVNRGS